MTETIIPIEKYERPRSGGRKLRVLGANEFAGRRAPERQWLADPLIPAGTVTLLGGDGGTGKSLLAMQLAGAVATPRQAARWCGVRVASGSVLYLSAEDDQDELHRRVEAICEATGDDLADMDRLRLICLAGEDAILAAPDKAGLKTTPLFTSIEQQIDTDRPALIIVDTLADAFGGQENERAQARQFIGLLRGWAIKYDTAVLVLAHPSLSGISSGSGTSGSTGWSNSVRSRLYLDREKAEDGFESDPDARVLKTLKANYGRTGGEIRLKWKDGVFINLDNAATSTAFGATAERARADMVFLRLLAAFEAEGRHVSAQPSTSYAPTVFARDPRSDGIAKRGLTDAMGRLFASNQIRVEHAGPPSRQRSRIVITARRETD